MTQDRVQFGLRSLASSNQADVVLWVGVLIVILVLAGLGVVWMRRRLLSRQDDAGSQAMLMEDLRRMRDGGQISTEEFDAARRALTRRIAGEPRAAERPARPSSDRPRGSA